jgi:CHAT domain-containing protein/Tfp pilus assembly protein PilF
MRRWWILGLMSLAGFGGSLPSIPTITLVSEALRPGAGVELEDEQAERLIALGLAEKERNHPAAAFDSFQKALRRAQESHSDVSEARALNHSGEVAMDLSELGAAGSFYRKALEKWETLGSPEGRLEALQGIAAFHLLRGEPARAVPFLQQTREIDPDRAGVLRLFGIAFFEDGKDGFALQVLRGALNQAHHEKDAGLQAVLLGDIGSVALRLGKIDQAAAAFEECLQISRANHFLAGEAYARAGRGRVLGVQGRFEQAMEELGQADAAFRSLGQTASLALVLAGEALLEKGRGNFQKALDLSSESIDLIESERREIAGPRARAQWLGAWSDPYELQIDVLWHLSRQSPGRGFEARAFEVSERIRARTLYEGLAAPRDISRPAAADLERQRREITIRLRSLEREKLRLSSTFGEEVRSQRLKIDAGLRDLIAQEGTLSELLRRSDPRSALVALQPLDLEQVQALLDRDTALLVYTLGRERSFVWWIDRGSLTMRELPSRRDIEAIASRVQPLLAGTAARRQPRQVDELLAQMSEIVLGPVADKLPRARQLAIVPDGALQTLPFAALPRPDATGHATREPLVASHVTTVLPSPSILDALRRREAERTVQPDKLIAAIVDPVYEPDDERLARQPQSPSTPLYPGLQRLRQTGGEARSILDLVPEGMGRIIEGFDAVPDVVLKSDLRRYRYLHFGAHGVVNKQAELSGIVLSQMTPSGETRDGLLRFYDVYDLDLPVDLVSLSTCRSADGPQIRREGPITMTRSFFYAGASRVLGTLWEVSDRPAAELTATFYEGVLREGKTPAEALRDAQDAMRLKGWPQQSWAPFVLQGDWR